MKKILCIIIGVIIIGYVLLLVFNDVDILVGYVLLLVLLTGVAFTQNKFHKLFLLSLAYLSLTTLVFIMNVKYQGLIVAYIIIHEPMLRLGRKYINGIKDIIK